MTVGHGVRRKRTVLIGTAAALAVSPLIAVNMAERADAVVSAGTVKGLVFRDYNANGARDGAEPGQAGITVRAVAASGAVVASTTSGADGSYALAVANGTLVRVEFNALPGYLRSGPHGAGSATSVQFVTSPAEAIDFGVANPAEYCQANPGLVTNCFAVAVSPAATHAIVKLADGNNSRTPGTASPGDADALANAAQVGSTWGLGVDPATKSLFSAAYAKRHTLFGPGGTGAVYRTQPGPNGAFGGGDDVTVLYATVPNAGTNPHPGVNNGVAPVGFDWLTDAAGFRAVGKVGLGDLDVAENGSELYTVNLNTASLVRVPVGAAASAQPSASVAIPSPAGCVAPRPFGLAVHDGVVYVGGVCSAEGGAASALSAYVYRFDPATGAFDPTPSLAFPLNYGRGCADRETDALGNSTSNTPGVYGTICPGDLGDWQPWNTAANELAVSQSSVHPEPMLTDIVFDRGAMVLGIRDRHGDQMGSENGTKDLSGVLVGGASGVFGISSGDLLRACPTASGWTIENNAACGATTTAGDNAKQGPGGGEYYFGDYHRSLGEQATPVAVNGDGGHDETTLGGLAQVAGRADVSSTAITPVQGGADTWSEGGVTWLSNQTGERTGAYRVYDQNPSVVFGKAAGLGDLEAICDAAPLEIGNRVWIDTNRNGLQEPGEPPVAGVTVVLVSPDGSTRSTTTDANGNYFFPVAPNTKYTVQITVAQPPLAGLTPTAIGSGSSVLVDSNGQANAAGTIVSTMVTTGGPGANDHTLDFGFSSPAPATPTTPPAVSGGPNPVPPGSTSSVLRIDKRAPAKVTAGQTFVYTITVRVPASAANAARAVTLRDKLPSGITAVQRQEAAITRTVKNGAFTWNLGTIKPGGSKTVTLRVRSTRDLCKPVRNVATVRGSNVARSVSDGATTRVQCSKAVVVPKVTG
jgi:uncharacterized repeat protein (TIGR01451 family)